MSLKSTLMGAFTALVLATPALADIEIHDQYARSSNAMAGAAFMVIHNHGDTDDHLISVTSDAAARVELHTHIEDADGVMRMTHVEEGFDLPAGGEIAMKRGAEHVMFMGLTDTFEQDEVITITLVFENAGEVVVEIPVDQNRMDMDHGDTDHGDMDHGSDG
ncbi:copper chaperone PCu(A)C [Octadecabacter sp. G9-8]|uniref:Copper chaperone PCu(A)C n=1 Tax=Octadecabacter dasysiphoniae TaxID=2909341 RepID=A0ABS9D1I2_9RHOB|nr:copper chaperone PCu(A)C [Octadecabacter dasysiphoniae]MCF2872489.1 copper chaperone PCu(A)C [Octadecabacter dasysiphoniae]